MSIVSLWWKYSVKGSSCAFLPSAMFSDIMLKGTIVGIFIS